MIEYILTEDEIAFVSENSRADLTNRGERVCTDTVRLRVNGRESFVITALTGRLPARRGR
jgi:hypothetical protein